MLDAYNKAFKDSKGSFRIKLEDGIPSSVYEVLGSASGSGNRNLLRPVHESSQWKWNPLF